MDVDGYLGGWMGGWMMAAMSSLIFHGVFPYI